MRTITGSPDFRGNNSISPESLPATKPLTKEPEDSGYEIDVTTESHEKRMRVAGQCALRFVGKIHVVSYFCFKILGNLKHRRFISTFYTWKGR